MKIFSYFDNINPDTENQEMEMINLWKFSWKKNGFEPVILGKVDAVSNPIYGKFIKLIEKIYLNITNSTIDKYTESCFSRWLAYANQKNEEHFLVSDYDVINKNLKEQDITVTKNKLSFFDGFCPSLCYGNAEQMMFFCEEIINVSSQNDFLIKKYSQVLNIKSFHDQDFIYLTFKILEDLKQSSNRSIRYFCERLNIVEEDKRLITLYEHDKRYETSGFSAYHVAHRSASEAKQKYSHLKDKDFHWIRIFFMNLLLLEEVDINS